MGNITPEQARKLGIDYRPPTLSPELEAIGRGRDPREVGQGMSPRLRAEIGKANASVAAGNAQARRLESRRKKAQPARVVAGQPHPDDDPETVEHVRLVAVLEASGLVYHHSPNGGWRPGTKGGGQLRRMGCQPGFPDILILSPTGMVNGAVIELKRPDAEPAAPWRSPPWAYSVFSDDQQKWLARFESMGWAALVAYSAEQAVDGLVACGYQLDAGIDELRRQGRWAAMRVTK